MMRSLPNSEIASILCGLVLASIVLFASHLQAIALEASVALVLGMMIWIAVQDVLDFTIPDGPLVCIALVGSAVRLATASSALVDEATVMAIDAMACGGAVLLVREGYYRLRGIEGVGFGDVKLAAVGGILVGIMGFAWALFIASVAGLVVAAGAAMLNPHNKITRLPFGAFLAPIFWCVWIVTLMETL